MLLSQVTCRSIHSKVSKMNGTLSLLFKQFETIGSILHCSQLIRKLQQALLCVPEYQADIQFNICQLWIIRNFLFCCQSFTKPIKSSVILGGKYGMFFIWNVFIAESVMEYSKHSSFRFSLLSQWPQGKYFFNERNIDFL